MDDRNRKLQNVTLDMMAGLHNAVVFARTSEGMRGTAGQWPAAGRKITAVITQSPPLGDPRHSALLSLVNNTYVGYVGGQFYALEHCGKVRRRAGAKCQVPGGGGAFTWAPPQQSRHS